MKTLPCSGSHFCRDVFFSIITSINYQNYIVDGCLSYHSFLSHVNWDYSDQSLSVCQLDWVIILHPFGLRRSIIIWLCLTRLFIQQKYHPGLTNKTNVLILIFTDSLSWLCKPLVWCHHNTQEISSPARSSEHTLWIKRLNIRILLTIMFGWVDHVIFILQV